MASICTTPLHAGYLLRRAAISVTAAFVSKSRKTLGEWVLREQSGWLRDRIVAAIQGTESISVKINHPIQVVTMYLTAVVMKNGEVHFFQDIYGDDAAFEKELAAQPHTTVTSGKLGQRPRE